MGKKNLNNSLCCTPKKTCDTAVTGHGVASGLIFQTCTRTCVTRDRDTAGLPVPVSHPTDTSRVPRSLFSSWYPFAAAPERIGGGEVAIGVVSGVIMAVVVAWPICTKRTCNLSKY